MGVASYERWTAAGLVQFRMPMTSEVGSYMTYGGKLELSFSGRQEKDVVGYRIRGGKLVTVGKARTLVFHYAGKTSWYRLDASR